MDASSAPVTCKMCCNWPSSGPVTKSRWRALEERNITISKGLAPSPLPEDVSEASFLLLLSHAYFLSAQLISKVPCTSKGYFQIIFSEKRNWFMRRLFRFMQPRSLEALYKGGSNYSRSEDSSPFSSIWWESPAASRIFLDISHEGWY